MWVNKIWSIPIFSLTRLKFLRLRHCLTFFLDAIPAIYHFFYYLQCAAWHCPFATTVVPVVAMNVSNYIVCQLQKIYMRGVRWSCGNTFNFLHRPRFLLAEFAAQDQKEERRFPSLCVIGRWASACFWARCARFAAAAAADQLHGALLSTARESQSGRLRSANCCGCNFQFPPAFLNPKRLMLRG